jgi:glycosyltransferase involved in cell wall biosynthesis
MGLQSRVRFVGECDEAEMIHLNSGALCSVILNAELGFGMAALESAAQARTFICPRSSGVASFFDEGIEAFYFDEGDNHELAALLANLLNEPPLAHRAGIAAWKKARSSLTWQHHAEGVARALQSVFA